MTYIVEYCSGARNDGKRRLHVPCLQEQEG
jgi:hypothetical protein